MCVFVCPPASRGLTTSSQWDLRSGEFPGHIYVLFPEPLSYHSCLMARCSIMLENTLFCHQTVCRYHSLFMAVFLGKIVSEPTPLAEKQPHTQMVSGCFTVGMTQD